MRSYRQVDDAGDPIVQRIPVRSLSRQTRPMSEETIDAILAYVERRDLGSLNREACELERRP